MRNISLSNPLEYLDLSLRTFNALKRAGVNTVGDLLSVKMNGKLKEIYFIGEKAYDEIVNQLNKYQIVDSKLDNEAIEVQLNESNNNEIEKYALYHERYKIYHEVVNELIVWQRKLIHKQLSMGSLHKNAIIDGETIGDILENSDGDLIWLSRKYSRIMSTSCVTEEMVYLIEKIPTRNLNIFIDYFGLPHHTLEEISIPLAITRERVRQILEGVKRTISKQIDSIFFQRKVTFQSSIRMQTALLIANQMGVEITFNDWKTVITQSGLFGNWQINPEFSIDLYKLFFAICNFLSKVKTSSFEIPENLRNAFLLAASGKPNIPAKTLIIEKTLDKKIKKQILRHACFSGGINAKWLSHEIEVPFSETIDILEILGFYHVTNDWFIEKDPRKIINLSKNHTFEHTLRKMTQYCGPLKINSIISGLRHAISRTDYPVPPPNVIERILKDKGYTCEEDLWYWDGAIDEQLNEGEKVILKCFEENGSIVHHSELAQAFIDSDLSFAALHATLNRSSIIEKFDYALYKLRGLKVTHEEIQRAKNEGDRIPIDLEIVPDKAGIIKVFGCLGILPIGTGSFYSENLPNLVGEWQCEVRNKQCGNITVVDNEIRGLLEAFEILHCKVGDRVSMSFNTWDRQVSIEKVS